MDLSISFMQQEDVEEVLLLERATFTIPWDERIFRKLIGRRNESTYLVARLDGLLLGYSGASMIGKEVHVTNMAVARRCRRKGIAAALLLACIKISIDRGARWLTLEVRESNLGAREFYEMFGFRDLGLRMGYYEDTGEHAVIMATGDIREEQYTEILKQIRCDLEARGVPGI